MSDSLPLELIDLILSHLCGTPSIKNCALVCHSWLPSARYHRFPQPKVLHLDQVKIVDFLHLIDSPLSTLSLISFSKLHITQNELYIYWDDPVTPEVKDWRNRTTIRDFLVRDLTFPCITSLFFECIDCRTLPPTALNSLHSNYKYVKELELRWVAFTLPELCNLIAALTALEKITIGNGIPFDSAPWTVDSVQMTHPRLCKLAFSNPPPSWIIQFFARAIGYTAGIVEVSLDLPKQYYNARLQDLQACGELLEVAGTSLQAVKLRVSDHGIPSSVDAEVSLAGLLAFPRNTNLQEIELNSVDEIILKLFLEGLKLNTKPNLRRLKLLGLENRMKDFLEKWTRTVEEAMSKVLLKRNHS